MLDHAGFPVSDYVRSKAFNLQALEPLGYVLVMEVQQDENDNPAAGFGMGGKPDFWIGGEGGFAAADAISSAEPRGSRCLPSRCAGAGGKDNGTPGLRPHYHPNYYAAFVLDPHGHNIEAVCHAPA